MPKPKSLNENAQITAAVLQLTASQGWQSVTLDKIAKTAKMSAVKLKARFQTINDIVSVMGEQIDREAFANVSSTGSVHDRLFDLLMARFDVLQKNRKAIENMADAARHDRALSLALGRATLDGIYRIIDVAQIKDKSPPRPVIAAGLSAVYTWAFCVWRRDNSSDMAKTMAALDRGLRLSGKVIELFKPRS